MIYIDKVGHLVSENRIELDNFALKIGLKLEWFQDKKLPHYDCTTQRKINKAIKFGAKLVSSKKIVEISKILK